MPQQYDLARKEAMSDRYAGPRARAWTFSGYALLQQRHHRYALCVKWRSRIQFRGNCEPLVVKIENCETLTHSTVFDSTGSRVNGLATFDLKHRTSLSLSLTLASRYGHNINLTVPSPATSANG